MSVRGKRGGVMTDFDDPQFDIEPRMIVRYLQHLGWSADDFGRKINRVFFKDDATDAVEIFFEKQASKDTKRKEVFFALKTISEFYEREISDISNDIKSLTYDQITSKIPNEYVLNDSIQLSGKRITAIKPAPPMVRLNDDKALDEILAERATFHLEQMDDNLWWLSVEAGGKQIDVWLRSKRKIKAHLEESTT
jgi:hypothetical protein